MDSTSSKQVPWPPRSRNHLAYIGLSIAEQVVQRRHPTLRLHLPAQPSLTSLLLQLSAALEFDTEPVAIPVDMLLSESDRKAFRALAIKSGDDEACTAKGVSSQGRAILTHGLLQSAPPLKPLTPGERARFKETFADVLNTKSQHPYFLVHPTHEAGIPVVECNMTLAAIDHETGMTECTLEHAKALWDTAAQMTLITDDALPPKFRAYLEKDKIHDAYRSGGSTRVQIGCLVEFSNHELAQFDTVATVVPRASGPNGRSGIILGQEGLIDSVCYKSIPRKIVVRNDPAFPEDRWGRLDIQAYCRLDGTLAHYE